MGNFFLGFPVPRAKIAEMIEGSAPPMEHKQWHEPDGSDPLALPGDISAGQLFKWDGSKFVGTAEPTAGMASRYADPNFLFSTRFVNSAAFESYTTGGGAITFSTDDVFLYTGTGSGAVADLYKNIAYPLPTLTWDKARRLKTKVKFRSDTNELGELWVCLGRYDYSNVIAFKCDDGILYGLTRDAGSESTVALETLGTGAFNETRDLEIVFTPGSKAEFYIDGSKIDEITTDLPSGTTHAQYPMAFTVRNLTNAKQLILYASQLDMYQAE